MEAKVKKYGKLAFSVLAVLLVVNTVAKRVPVVAQIKDTVDNGL